MDHDDTGERPRFESGAAIEAFHDLDRALPHLRADDLTRRWREAKLGERRGGRVAVWVECAEGVDPRAEVLRHIVDAADGLPSIGPLVRKMQAEMQAAQRTIEAPSVAAARASDGPPETAQSKPKRRKRTKDGE